MTPFEKTNGISNTSCSISLQNNFPNTDFDFESRILDILASLELRNWTKAFKNAELCLEAFPNHSNRRIVEALALYARSRHYLINQKLPESIKDCQTYLEKYSDQPHKPAVESVILWDEFRMEFQIKCSDYHSHKFRKAIEVLGEFAEKYPRHTDASRAINYTFRALYHGLFYDEFLQRMDQLEPWWFNESWADDVVFLKAAIYIRTNRGNEARNVLDFYEKNFPTSPIYNQA